MKFIIIIVIGILWSGLTNAICDYNYCLNGGICTDWWGTRFCDCEEEFNGEICQYEPCLEAPCQNGGDCHAEHASLTGAYTCTCYGDYYGTQCQYDSSINEATDLAVGIIIAIIVGGVIGIVFLAVCIGCMCYHHSHASATVAPTAPYVLQPQYPIQQRYPSAVTGNLGVSYKSFERVQLPQPAC